MPLTLVCVYWKPSTLITGTTTQSMFCARSCTSGSVDVSNSFRIQMAEADVIHSRAWMFASRKTIGFPLKKLNDISSQFRALTSDRCG